MGKTHSDAVEVHKKTPSVPVPGPKRTATQTGKPWRKMESAASVNLMQFLVDSPNPIGFMIHGHGIFTSFWLIVMVRYGQCKRSIYTIVPLDLMRIELDGVGGVMS